MSAQPPNPDLLYYRGRVGLTEILLSLGLKTGDQVATQAFTCVAVPEAILAAGCKPLYIDIEADTVNMCSESLRSRISNQTRCIIIQHTFGIPAQMDPLMTIAKEHGIPVVEDCCHTFSSTYDGHCIGSFGIAAFYSHEWGKPFVCGLGGSVRVNDQELENTLKNRILQFREPELKRRAKLFIQYTIFSILYRPSLYWYLKKLFRTLSQKGLAEGNYNDIAAKPSEDFQLRMPKGSRQHFKNKSLTISRHEKHSKEIASIYKSALPTGQARPIKVPTKAKTTYCRFPVWVENKEEFLSVAEHRNLESSEWYSTPIHPYSGDALRLVDYEFGSCPNAEVACGRIISLPVHLKTSKRQANKIRTLLST